MGENWNYVAFSDKKRFNLEGSGGFSCYWHDLWQNDPPRLSRNLGGSTVMCWAAFLSSSKTQMCFISTKMNSKMHTDLLEDILIPFMDDNMDGNAIFQHVLTLTKSWLTDHNITCLDLPACSPNINPIENLWDILALRVYLNGYPFEEVASLKQEITNAWGTIGQETLHALSKSMPYRIFAVAKY